MGEKMSPEVREALKFDLRLELDKRISPAKKRAHAIDTGTLAGWLVDKLELSNWIIHRGPPLEPHTIKYDLPVMNARPVTRQEPER